MWGCGFTFSVSAFLECIIHAAFLEFWVQQYFGSVRMEPMFFPFQTGLFFSPKQGAQMKKILFAPSKLQPALSVVLTKFVAQKFVN